MSATMAAVTVAAWLVLQVPMGMAIGFYIRHARALAEAQPRIRRRETHRRKQRPFDECQPPAVLLGN